MARLLVRKLEDDVKERLRERAQRHGRSIEEDTREVLRNAVRDEARSPEPLGRGRRARFAGIELDEDIAELRGHPAHSADLCR